MTAMYHRQDRTAGSDGVVATGPGPIIIEPTVSRRTVRASGWSYLVILRAVRTVVDQR